MSAKKTMLRDAADQYLEQMERKRRAQHTLRVDRNILARLILSVGNIQTQNINKRHIEEMFYGRQGLTGEHKVSQHGRTTNGPIGNATHNQYRNRLKVFFKWMADHDMITYTTATQCFDKDSGVVGPMKVAKVLRQRPAPPVLLSLLDAAANPRDRAYLAVALNLALRSNEIKRMLVGHVLLDEGYIQVTISKTKDSDEMMINSDLDPELRRWLVRYQADLGRPLEFDDYLFPTRCGGLINGSYMDEVTGKQVFTHDPYYWNPKKEMARTEDMVKRAMKKVGLETKYEGTHTLRRAVARAYFDMIAGERGEADALRATAALLHHASTATTERYLGTDIDRAKRDRRMAQQPFLSALVNTDNVVPLRPVGEGE